VKLFASTSALDTDFWAQLVDVFPNGYSMHLTEGIIRGRYRNSLEKQELLEPERIYEIDIDLWVTSTVFQRDHRVGLDISSSSFPKYDRNPNTGSPFGTDTTLKVANQKIYHDLEHLSHILLPVIK
jgi:putative CocE/NonD family hydrolase